MAKLRANIAYNRRKQESNSTMAHIDIDSKEIELPNTDLLDNEQNKESNPNGGENVLNIETEIVDENDNESDSDDDIEEAQIQDQLDQWLNILQENNENEDNLNFDLNIESIDHPAENNNAKWDLKIMFKDNLYCPF
jgi:hypothetical protein